jgi:formate hydrogenlyase subunit 6/NADH:ubiquinone oxidoreductase subunit I
LSVDICPVDCIHPTKNEAEAFQQFHQLYIDLEERIDCGLPDAFSCRRTSGNVARAGMPIIGSLAIF